MAILAGATTYRLLFTGAAPREIASNFGRIGKLGDEDDMRVVTKGTKNLEVDKTGKHFEDELPLLTKAGKRIGAIGATSAALAPP